MQIIGHRGVAGHELENTLPSFRRALQMGVDGIEFDVRLTRDKLPVVIHDESLDRTTSLSGKVRDFTLRELQTRLASPEIVPALEDVLGLATAVPLINVELKESAAAAPALEVLNRCVGDNVVRQEQLLVTSFLIDAVRSVREIDRHVPVGVLSQGKPEDAWWQEAYQLRASTANINEASVDEEFVARARDAGLRVMVYTVNSLKVAERMLSLGVDAIFSDYPDRVRV